MDAKLPPPYLEVKKATWSTTRSLLFVVATVFVAYIFTRWWKNRRTRYLGSKIPGPPITDPILGNILMFLRRSLVECFVNVRQFHEEYGPIFRIWGFHKLVVFISDPDSTEKTIGNKKFENRGRYIYEVTKPIFNKGIITSRGESWRSHRKIISSAFHTNILEEFVNNFSKNGGILVEQLLQKADGTTFNLYPYVFLCSLDIIVETSSGITVNAQTDANNEYAKYMLRCLEIVVERFRQPWLMVDWINNLTSIGKEQNAIMKIVNQQIYDCINDKIKDFTQNGSDKTDLEDKDLLRKKKLCLTDLLIQSQTMNVDEIRDEVATTIGAGSETSSTTVCYVLSLLGVHKDVQEKVVEEQRSIFGKDIYRAATAEDVKAMSYLEMVIKETMRIFPPVPFVFRLIDEEVDIGHGYTLPVGTYCIVNNFEMHRNPKYFPDPDRFDPERFSPENITGRHPYAYVPFGAGRRFCVGFQYAMLETKTLLSTLLRKYRVTYTPGGIAGLVKKLEAGLVVKPYDGFPMQLMPRYNPSDAS